jgi:hypothetical protein
VGDLILLLGRMLIAAACVLLALALLEAPQYKEGLSSPLMPAVVVAVLAFLAASIFMAIVGES